MFFEGTFACSKVSRREPVEPTKHSVVGRECDAVRRAGDRKQAPRVVARIVRRSETIGTH